MRSGSGRRWLRLTALVPAVLFALWFVLLRPPFMGGDTTYLIVSGRSMEPALYTNDLVVVKRTGDYRVGDVVAFQVGEGLVIHRIIGGDAESGFVMQGDNRDAIDPWAPTPESIVGRQVLRVPQAGHAVAWLSQSPVFGAAVVGISLLGGFGSRQAVQRRRRRGRMRTHDGGGGRGPGWPSGTWWRGSPPLLGALVVTSVLGGLFLAIAALAFRSPAEVTEYVEEVAYEHTATFDYAIAVEPSTLYPDGHLAPQEQADGTLALPQPAYRQLTDAMTIDFTYELQALLPPLVSGELAADLVIGVEDGWTRTEPLMSPQRFEGPTAAGSVTLDFASIQAVINQIEEETGFSPGAYTFSIEPRIAIEGTLGGHAIDDAYAPAFAIEYGSTRIAPAAELSMSEPVSIGENVTLVNRMSVLGVDAPVRAWRWIGVAGAVVALAAAGAAAAVAFLGLGRPEPARIRARYGGMLVPVESNGSGSFDSAIHVGSIDDLARLARRDGGIIFYERGPWVEHYFVRDGEDTYDYAVPAADGEDALAAADERGEE